MASGVHFLIIPLMCPGHLIPMVDMAKLIAQHSATVTIVITPGNAARFGSVLHRAVSSGHPIRIRQLQFPTSGYGLPEGCENIDDLPTLNLIKNFFKASAKLQEPLEEMFNDLKPRPSCIISDKNLSWTADVTRKFEIPWVIFDGMSCFTRLATHNLLVSKIHERVGDFDRFLLPSLPDKITMTKSQLPGLFNPAKSADAKEIRTLHEKIRASESQAYGIVINSFEELEGKYLEEYRKVKQNVWCIGPFSLSNKNDLDKAQRGTNCSITNHERTITWLDSQKPMSVVYACLGTLSQLTPLQLIELALGLEESESPFILVLKGGNRTEEMEKWLAEDGFETRVKGRGVLIHGWAPQVLILLHPSVGAFLTHCGWNSTIEGVCAGVPMMTWPQFSEQFFNERVVVDVVGSGVGVGAESVVRVGEEDAGRVQVKRMDVCKAVKMIMDDGIEGKTRREKGKYFREMAEKAIEEEGSSKVNLKLFIEDIMLHMNKGLQD
ncbi:hypothetical protein LXL04_005076 [Taraxacum kok-saghyz]